MENLIELGYLISIISFLAGLKFMSSPKRAKLGNIIAAAGMVLAVCLTIGISISANIPRTNLLVLSVAIFFGGVAGKRIESKVEMTKMPQLVSLFNATGGACALLIGIIEASQNPQSLFLQFCLFVGVITSGVAVTGSLIAYSKLSGKKLRIENKNTTLLTRTILLALLFIPALILTNIYAGALGPVVYIVAILSLVYGILFVAPIGGADMPVIISFLNSITGIATAFAGLVYGSYVMIVGGIIVGAAGILLTALMCKAMNRSFLTVLSGKIKKGSKKASEKERIIQEISLSEVALELSYSSKIAIVPGYGLAVAQAQHICSHLQKLLEGRDTEVHFIVHPVAGRMPGHMNVLLAEASVDYSYLKEMEEVNEEMDSYDLSLIIGANDVVNPAAENDEESPVYGMPIIRTHHSRKVVVMKRGMSTGYAGVQNDLFEMDNCFLLFGDAKDSLTQLVDQLKLISK